MSRREKDKSFQKDTDSYYSVSVHDNFLSRMENFQRRLRNVSALLLGKRTTFEPGLEFFYLYDGSIRVL